MLRSEYILPEYRKRSSSFTKFIWHIARQTPLVSCAIQEARTVQRLPCFHAEKPSPAGDFPCQNANTES